VVWQLPDSLTWLHRNDASADESAFAYSLKLQGLGAALKNETWAADPLQNRTFGASVRYESVT
jgi:hypothetical protein